MNGGHAAIDGDALALTQPFIAEEEEGVILPDWSAEVGAELVALER